MVQVGMVQVGMVQCAAWGGQQAPCRAGAGATGRASHGGGGHSPRAGVPQLSAIAALSLRCVPPESFLARLCACSDRP